MIWFIIIILIVLIDQIVKFIIANNIDANNPVVIINNFLHMKFQITNVRNTGAAWGMLQNGRYFFIGVTIVISVILIYFLFKSNNKVLSTSLCFILGGALGNFIDRAFKGNGVVDFLDFFFGSYHFPTFNVADSFIVMGTILLAFYLLFIHKEEEGIAR